MIHRCTNKKNTRYEKYGGKGVSVCREWMKDFTTYDYYIRSLPNAMKSKYTLDRIDNDGNYELGNLRWATAQTQQANHSLHCNNTSGYRGVTLKKHCGLYASQLTVNYKEIHIGYFKDPLKAAIARNKYILDNNLERGYMNKIEVHSSTR